MSTSSKERVKQSIIPIKKFDVAADVGAVKKILGTPDCETALADFLTHRSNQQRQEIKKAYKGETGRDLTADVVAKICSGRYKDVVVGLLEDGLEFAVRVLCQAMKGMGTDEKALVDMLCTRPRNVEIAAIKEKFKEMYKCDLETMLKDETSGPFLALLLKVAEAVRVEHPTANIEEQAKEDAAALLKAGEGRSGEPWDDSKFIDILATRPLIQLSLATFKLYAKDSKVGSIEKALEAGDCSHEKDGYLALVLMAEGKLHEFFADRLYKAVKGLGTDDDCLIRVLISRSEVDLGLIRDAFKKKYGMNLVDLLKDDTSGDYCNILVKIVEGNTPKA